MTMSHERSRNCGCAADEGRWGGGGDSERLRTRIIGVNDAYRAASAIVCVQLLDYAANTFRIIRTVRKSAPAEMSPLPRTMARTRQPEAIARRGRNVGSIKRDDGKIMPLLAAPIMADLHESASRPAASAEAHAGPNPEESSGVIDGSVDSAQLPPTSEGGGDRALHLAGTFVCL